VALVDSNILLDIFARDSSWSNWSAPHLDEAALNEPLLINDVIYAETSVGFRNVDDFDAALAELGVAVTPIPRLALFLAFTQYRRAGGTRTGVLPDFFIGAHATVEGMPLLTRDARRYRHYFPKVQLIAPMDESGRSP
jgi:predicted nucleic acid-binding protein